MSNEIKVRIESTPTTDIPIQIKPRVEVVEKQVEKTKFGASADAWIGDVDANGVLQAPTETFVLDLTGVEHIGANAFNQSFYTNKTIAGVDLSSLITVDTYGFYYAFYQCPNLTGVVDFGSLTTVEQYGLAYAFYLCPNLTGVVDLSSLTTVGAYGFKSSFCRTGITGVDFGSLKTVDAYGLADAFDRCLSLTGAVDFGSLTTVGNRGLNNTFYRTAITGVDFGSLTTVDAYGLYYVVDECSNLTGVVDLSSLTTVEQYGLAYAFRKTGITGVDLSSLTTVGASGLSGTFDNCSSLSEPVLFPALTTVNSTAFSSYTFRNCTNLTEIHFRADMQETIESLSGYSSKFGAPSTCTIYFDL